MLAPRREVTRPSTVSQGGRMSSGEDGPRARACPAGCWGATASEALDLHQGAPGAELSARASSTARARSPAHPKEHHHGYPPLPPAGTRAVAPVRAAERGLRPRPRAPRPSVPRLRRIRSARAEPVAQPFPRAVASSPVAGALAALALAGPVAPLAGPVPAEPEPEPRSDAPQPGTVAAHADPDSPESDPGARDAAEPAADDSVAEPLDRPRPRRSDAAEHARSRDPRSPDAPALAHTSERSPRLELDAAVARAHAISDSGAGTVEHASALPHARTAHAGAEHAAVEPDPADAAAHESHRPEHALAGAHGPFRGPRRAHAARCGQRSPRSQA